MDWKRAFHMLANANDIGVYLMRRDGHYWIRCDREADVHKSVNKTLRDAGICLNDKIYDGLISALVTLDMALKMAEHAGIDYKGDVGEEQFKEVHHDRIDKVARGEGGLT